MAHAYKKLVCIFMLAAWAAHAVDTEQGIQQFNPNELRFNAAEKLTTGFAGGVGAVAGGSVGFIAGATGRGGSSNRGAAMAFVGAVVGAAISIHTNNNYSKAYDAANGKNIYGAAAANNAQGVQAWMNYTGAGATMAQDNNKMTPLMYAAANGGFEATQVISDAMPDEYKVDESITETETVKTERGLTRFGPESLFLPETTKSKSVKKKILKTADLQDNAGRTAAHWAFYGEHYKLMLYLISRGKANAKLKDNFGKSIENMTVKGRSVSEVLEELRKHCLRGCSR